MFSKFGIYLYGLKRMPSTSSDKLVAFSSPGAAGSAALVRAAGDETCLATHLRFTLIRVSLTKGLRISIQS